MRKLTILAVMAGVVAVLATMVTLLPLAGGGPAQADDAPKATGDIEYYQPGYFFNFNAHEAYDGRPTKGEASNYAPGGGWYQAEVRCAEFDGDMAWFAAELVDTNMADWGPWVLVKVLDGGTPGTEGDKIWGEFLPEAAAVSKCDNGQDPTNGPWDVLSGNLVVHN